MSRKISKFRFKQFEVSHHRSSMKVGVDGVLIGCWAAVEGAKHILDVGTGCGLIALMMAQRAGEAEIDAIDIDAPSIEEAAENIAQSPWSDRINAMECSFSDLGMSAENESDSNYDLIISNPPYFDSGVTETHSAREKARHQGELSPYVLLRDAHVLLRPCGSLAMVVPADISESLEGKARELGYRLERKCLVRGHREAPYKRALLQWRRNTVERNQDIHVEYLTIELYPGIPTEEYRRLCRDFYLKF